MESVEIAAAQRTPAKPKTMEMKRNEFHYHETLFEEVVPPPDSDRGWFEAYTYDLSVTVKEWAQTTWEGNTEALMISEKYKDITAEEEEKLLAKFSTVDTTSAARPGDTILAWTCCLEIKNHEHYTVKVTVCYEPEEQLLRVVTNLKRKMSKMELLYASMRLLMDSRTSPSVVNAPLPPLFEVKHPAYIFDVPLLPAGLKNGKGDMIVN